RDTLFVNRNAADPRTRQTTLDALDARLNGKKKGRVAIVLHSLAFGSLRPFVAPTAAPGDAPGDEPDDEPEAALDAAAMTMTLDVMAHSLVYWVQDLLARDLLTIPGGRVLALTSAGSEIAWPAYGAVSAAKAALEAHCRQLALELAPRGVTVNAISAGICDTPALRKIPGWRKLLADAEARNPSGRTTRPDDVASVVGLLARPEAAWINGSVIRVDGGEGIAGLAGPTEPAETTGSNGSNGSDGSDDGVRAADVAAPNGQEDLS
ncbi:MAG: SDR family oxidoreductase, partial [Deltaproteobacteria bacterium]|nr:SDR family oxidoreductase [Deltaproteobacteria bacterium]